MGRCQKFARIWMYFASFSIILLGIAIIIIATTQLNIEKYIPKEQVQDFSKIITKAIMGIGGFIIIIGILGLIGTYKKLLIFLLFLIFLAVGIIFFSVAKGYVKKVNCSSSEFNIDDFKEADQAFYDGSRILCSQICPCNMNNVTYNNVKNDIKPISDPRYPGVTSSELQISDNGVISVTQCKDYNSAFTSSQKFLLEVFKNLEEKYDCSGLCQKPPYYILSDINRTGFGPKSNCVDKIIDLVYQLANMIGSTSLVIAFIMFWTIICSCIVCCSKKKKSKITTKDDERLGY